MDRHIHGGPSQPHTQHVLQHVGAVGTVENVGVLNKVVNAACCASSQEDSQPEDDDEEEQDDDDSDYTGGACSVRNWERLCDLHKGGLPATEMDQELQRFLSTTYPAHLHSSQQALAFFPLVRAARMVLKQKQEK